MLKALVLLPALVVADDLEGTKSRVASIGDLDGDGVAEIVVASRAGWVGRDHNCNIPIISGSDRNEGEPQVVWIISGKEGELLRTLGPNRLRSFGSVVLDGGDIDGDGLSEIVIGNGLPYGDVEASISTARVWVFSGRSGEELHMVNGGLLEEGRPVSVAAGADCTGDRRSDIIVGDPEQRRIMVYSAPNLAVAKVVERRNHKRFGHAVALVPDADGDDIAEVLVASTGLVCLISCRSGETLMSFDARGKSLDGLFPENLVWECGYAGDIDGDQVGDYFGTNIHAWCRIWSGSNGEALVGSEWYGGDFAGEGASCALLRRVASRDTSCVVVAANEGFLGLFSAGNICVLGDDIHETLVPTNVNDPEGYDVCGVGDVDGDGIDDLAMVTRVSNELGLRSMGKRQLLYVRSLGEMSTAVK